MNELAPPRKEYQVFTLKHASAFWVASNLEDFFKLEDKSRGRRSWWQGAEQKERRRLSKRRPLKFISDYDTNTILVQGADPGQLNTIKELIALYDKPEPVEMRQSIIFQVRYSKAKIIAATVKDVYRDLLSSNDKALQKHNETEAKGKATRRVYIWGGSEGKQRTQVRFKDQLSIGVDELSNTLIISAQGQNLLENVLTMIDNLDKAARPTSTVQVLKLDRRINSDLLQRKLANVLGTGSPGRRPGSKQPSRQQPNQAGAQRAKGNSKGNAKSANCPPLAVQLARPLNKLHELAAVSVRIKAGVNVTAWKGRPPYTDQRVPRSQ